MLLACIYVNFSIASCVMFPFSVSWLVFKYIVELFPKEGLTTIWYFSNIVKLSLILINLNLIIIYIWLTQSYKPASSIEFVHQCSFPFVICFHLGYFFRLLKPIPVTKSSGSALYNSSENKSLGKITKKLVSICII